MGFSRFMLPNGSGAERHPLTREESAAFRPSQRGEAAERCPLQRQLGGAMRRQLEPQLPTR